MSRVAYVLWSPQSGPICAYENEGFARAHAASMLGIQVSRVELRDALSEIVRRGMEDGEYEDETPALISIDDIDDAPDDASDE